MEHLTEDPWMQRVRFWIAVLVLGILGSLFIYWVAVVLPPWYPAAGEVLKNHLAAIIGLPIAAVVSLVVVLLLRQVYGPIEIRGPAFSVTGATGPVILWILSFFVIVWAIKELWSATP